MFLVSCVSAKRSRPLPARELYCSDWFVTPRDYVEAQAEDWYILSAKYGLVEPDEVIEPYNETLSDISSAERRAWAERVAGQVRPKCREEPEIVILAGQAYREHLLLILQSWRCRVRVPMKGLRIGQQNRWLIRAREAAQVDAHRRASREGGLHVA
jgi:hypothetical protein